MASGFRIGLLLSPHSHSITTGTWWRAQTPRLRQCATRGNPHVPKFSSWGVDSRVIDVSEEKTAQTRRKPEQLASCTRTEGGHGALGMEPRATSHLQAEVLLADPGHPVQLSSSWLPDSSSCFSSSELSVTQGAIFPQLSFSPMKGI